MLGLLNSALGRNSFWFDWKELISTQVNPALDWKQIFALGGICTVLDTDVGEGMAPAAVLKGGLGVSCHAQESGETLESSSEDMVFPPPLSLNLMISSCLFSFH